MREFLAVVGVGLLASVALVNQQSDAVAIEASPAVASCRCGHSGIDSLQAEIDTFNSLVKQAIDSNAATSGELAGLKKDLQKQAELTAAKPVTQPASRPLQPATQQSRGYWMQTCDRRGNCQYIWVNQ